MKKTVVLPTSFVAVHSSQETVLKVLRKSLNGLKNVNDSITTVMKLLAEATRSLTLPAECITDNTEADKRYHGRWDYFRVPSHNLLNA